ncbi:MAG: hypothetical protein A3K19_30040 [Lentisphaerae bacterium RIFOXYB12_FULL_65_16]|nr:MAG: hypothetical protein A3K18_33650 [Lentisphaerae bacterium RIFOXYA12_64_32]OGV86566.1 MAG: hypothetical protein A3K19_30040 [Lentisphaerae bacterium RIFOXYB12_FULL_65_16]
MENNRAATAFFFGLFATALVTIVGVSLCLQDVRPLLLGLAMLGALLLGCYLAGLVNAAVFMSIMKSIKAFDAYWHRGRADEHRAPKSNTED